MNKIKFSGRKVLIHLFLLIFVSMALFAQQGQNQQGQNQKKALDLKHRAGIFISYEPTIGSLSDYVYCSLGGGLQYELGFSILDIFEIGPSVHIAANGNIIKSESLASMMNLKIDAGCFFRIPLWNTGLIFSPELDYGMLIYIPKANPEYYNSDSIKTSYVDQLIQLALSLRYSHEKVLNGNLEFELTPIYLFSPEKDETIHYLGLKLGALYKIGGKK
ncbi:MAG: hypothetical protein K6G52_04125 [Treponemataceae bacterium]|nr:hypothetical protein [Treponemataceae bacterium]